MLPETRTLIAVADFFGLPNTDVVAKDFHVVQAIKALATLDATPFTLVFGGGTALARAHKLIERMSEDVDFKIVPSSLTTSRSALRKQLGTLRESVTEALQKAGFIFDANDPNHLRSRNEHHYNIYHIPYEYQAPQKQELRATLQIELTYATLRCPTTTLPVASFVADAFQSEAEVPTVSCVSVNETAAEKIVSITRRTAAELAGVNRDVDPTLVRHIYDLHVIREHIDHATVTNLAHVVAEEDAVVFKNQYPEYQENIIGETRKAIAALQADPVFKDRYQRFVAAMVYGQKPTYEEALATLIALAEKL